MDLPQSFGRISNRKVANELDVPLAQLAEPIEVIFRSDVPYVHTFDSAVLQAEDLRAARVAALYIPGLQIEASHLVV